MLFSIVFGALVLHLFRELQLMTLRMLSQMRRFRWLVVCISFSMFCKCTYLLVLSTIINARHDSGDMSQNEFALFWFFYYVVAEMIPSFLVLLVLYRERQATAPKGYMHIKAHPYMAQPPPRYEDDTDMTYPSQSVDM